MPANLENSAMATGLEKVSFHSNHTKKALPKKLAESFKRGFNSTWTVNFQMFRLDLEKAEEPEIKLSLDQNIRWIIKKAREFQKNIYLCFIDYATAFNFVYHNKL